MYSKTIKLQRDNPFIKSSTLLKASNNLNRCPIVSIMIFFLLRDLLSLLDWLYDQKNLSWARRVSHQVLYLYQQNYLYQHNIEYNINQLVRMSDQTIQISGFISTKPSCPPYICIFTQKKTSKTFHAFEKILRISKTNNNNPATFNGK